MNRKRYEASRELTTSARGSRVQWRRVCRAGQERSDFDGLLASVAAVCAQGRTVIDCLFLSNEIDRIDWRCWGNCIVGVSSSVPMILQLILLEEGTTRRIYCFWRIRCGIVPEQSKGWIPANLRLCLSDPTVFCCFFDAA